MFLIDDCTPERLLFQNGHSRGLDLRTRPNPGGYAYGAREGRRAAAEPFPKSLIIPRHEWQARIEEMEQQKSRLSDIFTAGGGQVKFQNPLNYCWVFAVTSAVETNGIIQGAPYVSLSPASAGAQIKNFQNEGGYGIDALRFIADHGLVPSALWPDNSLDRQYLTDAAKREALKYRETEWWELAPRNDDHLVSSVLRRIPVPIGLDYWGHEVLAMDAVWVDGAIAIRFLNSWGLDWGEKGFGVLQGQRMKADDAVCCRVAMAA